MAMLPMVERRDAWGEVSVRASVRDDLIYDYVACVPCKGGGERWLRTGGSMRALGWEAYSDFGCPHCCGRGIYRVQ